MFRELTTEEWGLVVGAAGEGGSGDQGDTATGGGTGGDGDGESSDGASYQVSFNMWGAMVWGAAGFSVGYGSPGPGMTPMESGLFGGFVGAWAGGVG